MLGAYPLQKRRKRRISSFFSLILHRYDLREVDGVSCRIFDIYPVASEHAVIEISKTLKLVPLYRFQEWLTKQDKKYLQK